jgi:hypothetical protein
MGRVGSGAGFPGRLFLVLVACRLIPNELIREAVFDPRIRRERSYAPVLSDTARSCRQIELLRAWRQRHERHTSRYGQRLRTVPPGLVEPKRFKINGQSHARAQIGFVLHRGRHSKRPPPSTASKAIKINRASTVICLSISGPRNPAGPSNNKLGLFCSRRPCGRTYDPCATSIDAATTYAFNARRRAELGQSGSLGPLKVKWVCFETLVRSTSMPEAFRAHRDCH